MRRLSSRHRSIVLNRCVAVSPPFARAVRPLAAGAPFAIFARVLFQPWRGCLSLRQPAYRQHPLHQVRLHRRARHAAFGFSSSPCRSSSSGAKKVIFLRKCLKPQIHIPSLPWLPAKKFNLCRGIGRLRQALSGRLSCPVRLIAGLVPPRRHTSSRRVGSSHLRSSVGRYLAFTAGLTRRCSGLPSAAAELQR
jgi:hypothetical protein